MADGDGGWQPDPRPADPARMEDDAARRWIRDRRVAGGRRRTATARTGADLAAAAATGGERRAASRMEARGRATGGREKRIRRRESGSTDGGARREDGLLLLLLLLTLREGVKNGFGARGLPPPGARRAPRGSAAAMRRVVAGSHLSSVTMLQIKERVDCISIDRGPLGYIYKRPPNPRH